MVEWVKITLLHNIGGILSVQVDEAYRGKKSAAEKQMSLFFFNRWEGK